MALLWTEGFEKYGTGTITTEVAASWGQITGGILTATGRFGGLGGFLTGNDSMTKVLDDDYTTLILGFAVRMSDLDASATEPFVDMRDGTTSNCRVYVDTSKRLVIVYGNSTTVVTDYLFYWNNFYYIEIKLVVDSSSGSVIVKVDNESLL